MTNSCPIQVQDDEMNTLEFWLDWGHFQLLKFIYSKFIYKYLIHLFDALGGIYRFKDHWWIMKSRSSKNYMRSNSSYIYVIRSYCCFQKHIRCQQLWWFLQKFWQIIRMLIVDNNLKYIMFYTSEKKKSFLFS